MTARERLSFAVAAALGAGLITGMQPARAVDLTWDPNAATAPDPSDGSGAWEDAGNWYDTVGAASVSWTSGSDNAIIGAGTGAAGTATVTLGAAQTANALT